LNKVETVELLKSLIECDLDKVQDEPNKPKVHVPVFSVGRQGIKYLVKFVRNNYEKIERNESENKGNATEYIGWDFKIAMYTDEMIGDGSMELSFRFTESGNSAKDELRRISEFAASALKEIQKESVKAEP